MASHVTTVTHAGRGGPWQGLFRLYERLEATERGYVWLSKLGPAYLFGLIAAIKCWALLGSLSAMANDEPSLDAALQAGYQATSFVFFALVASLYVLRRRPIRRVANPFQGIIALFGSYVMMPVALSGHVSDDRGVMITAVALMVVGTGGAALALASLGRCFGIFPEARGLVTSGAYRFVRHPMYLFEFLAFFGILLPAFTLLNAGLYAAFVVFQLGRMHYEEQTLEQVFPAEYPAYRARTARLIPGLY